MVEPVYCVHDGSQCAAQHPNIFLQLTATDPCHSFLRRHIHKSWAELEQPKKLDHQHVAAFWITGSCCLFLILKLLLPWWTIWFGHSSPRHWKLLHTHLCKSQLIQHDSSPCHYGRRTYAALEKWLVMIISCGAVLASWRAHRWMADQLANLRGRQWQP